MSALTAALPPGAYVIECDGAREVHRNGLDVPMVVTRFEDEKAQTKRDAPLTLRQMADDIAAKSAPAKRKLPWLKLAQFGDMRTEKGSLRHGANIQTISGLEGDYDAGTMTPETGADLLRLAGVAAAVFTSPGHHGFEADGSPKGERWRVLCPLSRPHEPSEREALAARLNGVLGGVLSGESFTTSQAYYYGKVGDAPAHRVILVDGKALDHAPELDATAIGRPGGSAKLDKIELPAGLEPDATALAALQAACALFEDKERLKDKGRHPVMCAATMAVAPFVKAGLLDRRVCVQTIEEAMTKCDGGRKPEFKTEVLDALTGALAKVRAYEPQISAQDEFPPLEPMPEPGLADAAPDTENVSLVYAYGENPYGARRWLIHKVLPETGVALLSGQWGIGKTFVAVDLATCAMFGTPFARHTVDRQCGVLWLAAEGEAEISDRLHAALEARPEVAGLPVPFVWADRFPLLLATDAVKQFEHIILAARERVEGLGAKLGLIILDTMAAGAGWDSENDAAEAQKAMNLLRKIARHYGCLVVAIDHYGKDQGGGTRGSTAKEAAADAVLALLGDRKDSGKIEKSRMAVRKARGGVAGLEYPFGLPWRVIGTDDEGRDITTCTVAWKDKATAKADEAKALVKEPKPESRKWHEVLQCLLMTSPGMGVVTTEDAWKEAGIRKGLISSPEPDETRGSKEARRKKFSNAKSDLVTCGWIACDGETVRDIQPFSSLADLVAD
jgi:AAA domain